MNYKPISINEGPVDELYKQFEEKITNLFKRSVRVFNMAKNRMMKVIERMSDEQFDAIKKEMEESFQKDREIYNLSLPTKPGYIGGLRGGPRPWQYMDPANLDWSELTKGSLLKELQRYKAIQQKQQLHEAIVSFRELIDKSKKGMVKAAMIMWITRRLLKDTSS